MKNNINQLVRKNILELQPYTSARDEYNDNDGVFLDANENPIGNYNRYPDPYQFLLKEKIANIKKVAIDNVYIGNGSDEIIDLAFRIFCEPNIDKALTFSPTYGMYDVAAKLNAIELIKIPLNDTFQIDLSALDSFIHDPTLKLIFICSPNNPTGNNIDPNSILYILNNFNGIIIIDEAYIDFSDQASFIDKLAAYPNLIVSQTLSKAWGLAGARIGLAFMNNELLKYYNKVKAPYNVSSINQEIALEKLNKNNEVQLDVDTILKEKLMLIESLNSMVFINKIFPSDTNFLLVEVQDADAIYQYLLNKKIIIRNRNSAIKNSIRITIGSPSENKILLNALKQFDNA